VRIWTSRKAWIEEKVEGGWGNQSENRINKNRRGEGDAACNEEEI